MSAATEDFSSVAAIFSLQGVQAGGDIKIHHHYPAEQPKEEIVPPDLYHLPKPTTALIGRKTELAQLTEAFTNPGKRLAIIVAAGGIGKSALTDECLQQIAAHNYYGKTRVFGWSFYSQGSHNTFTNSQPFFSAVLPFLGIAEIPKDEIEKARALARCLQQQPCLLILDGLEPLQYSENLQSMNGELQDSALKEFIACFRQTAGKSFVLLSSRQLLVELKEWQPEHYLSLDLKTLPHDDGADLLQALGVTGNAAERQAVSQDLNGHALSLVLMGHLLSEHHQGDFRYAKELPPLTSAHGDSDAEKDSRHAVRVLDYYDSLQDDTSRRFLQLLGLFDRPMIAAEKAVLIANANHAEPLRALTNLDWKKVEQRLEKSGLLLGKKGTFVRLEWDTHPIIRAYFGQKFKECHPEKFKQAHFVLFDYYQKLPEKEFPDTLEEMLPLYRAVVHGCFAGEYYEALSDVYKDRITQGDNEYSVKKLGASSQDLTALSVFFQQTWLKPLPDLSEITQAWLLAQVSFCLMSLGRLCEAYEVREVALALHDEQKNWTESANNAGNLADLALVMGKIKDAQKSAYYALTCIKHAKDEIRKILIKPNNAKSALLEENLSNDEKKQLTLIVKKELTSHGRVAPTFYFNGDFKQAKQWFEKTELLWQKNLQDIPWFSGVVGAQYCSYLLDTVVKSADLEQILARGKYALEIAVDDNQPLDIARARLTLAQIYQAQMQSKIAKAEFDLAVQINQKENFIFELPISYLYRADFYLTQNQLDPALADLNSAYEIIELRDMKLYVVDYLLIHGRYCLVTEDFDTALDHYIEAKQLIQETGYHLRDAELDLFAAQICFSTKQNLDSKNAEHYLQKAKNRIEEIGQYGLIPRWEKVSESGF
jgi:tetratricopeptide (TPR) repeat protein